ncbi:glycosyltransferase [Azoarcus olearius]|uniref:Glycosyltransferase n=1 Tax=Azoarcus sp. (strain BH72) TaxID=418699 RepID=A1K6F0_AZOSB|nr:glycosyltransferase [Azoarcus olearius]CAL94405.1 glycosyltransferase [Azoarcus olearius]
MHVCDATMFYSARSGGIRRYLQEKRRWLQARPGYRHSLVLPRLAAGAAECAIEVPSVPLPFSQGYRLPLMRESAVRALAELRPHVIEAGDPYQFAWAALDAGQRLGVPVVGFYHSDVPRLFGRVGGAQVERLAESYLRRLYSRFDLVMAPSACMTERLRELGLEHVVRQPLGVDTRLFRPRPARNRKLWRGRLDAGDEDRLLLFVGRFAHEKNLPVLQAMMDRLGPGYLLVLVGNGTPPAAREDTRVVPYIAEPARLASLIAACDLFVHAGDQETFGIAPLEAMACGLPVVAARAGGLAETVDAQVGRAVPVDVPPADNPEPLAAAMADAVRELFDYGLQPLRSAARKRAESYDWERILPDIVGRYAALAGTPALPQ